MDPLTNGQFMVHMREMTAKVKADVKRMNDVV